MDEREKLKAIIAAVKNDLFAKKVEPKKSSLSPESQKLLKDFEGALLGKKDKPKQQAEPIDVRGAEGMRNVIAHVLKELPNELRQIGERQRAERQKAEYRKNNPSPGEKLLDDFSIKVVANMDAVRADKGGGPQKFDRTVRGPSEAATAQLMRLDLAKNGDPRDSQR